MLGLEHRPVTNKLVLEVGTCVGGTANYMASSEGCELVGIDLSYAVESAYHHFGGNRFLHLIQASAFATPFRENTFDLVYSHGVLHHTFSTKIAFERISKLPKAGGRLYIWVYNPHSETRTWSRRIVMDMEKVIRPFCWRLPERLQTLALAPIIPLYFVHQNFYMKRDKSSEYIKYGWQHAMHAARDRFTPRYAPGAPKKRCMNGFREAGYTEIRSVGKTERPNFVPIHFVVGTAVEGIRHLM
jgi:SAM-dependent methyltransferase